MDVKLELRKKGFRLFESLLIMIDFTFILRSLTQHQKLR